MSQWMRNSLKREHGIDPQGGLTDFEKWMVAEYFGARYQQEVSSVYCMSPLTDDEDDDWRIYVKFTGPRKDKVVACSYKDLAQACVWWNDSPVKRSLQGVWYRPMATGPDKVPCMWCGVSFGKEVVDEHERACGG